MTGQRIASVFLPVQGLPSPFINALQEAAISKSPTHKWTHDGLAHDLAAHLRSSTARMVWTDMQLGRSGSPRPDVYTINKSFVSPRPVAYEVKVSPADFRSDVTKGKWQTYLPYATGVTFAVPRGLIAKADLPPTCGLMVRAPAGWKTIKSPTLGIVTLSEEVMLKLLIGGLDRLQVSIGPRDASIWNTARQLRESIGDKISDAILDSDGILERARQTEQRANVKLEHASTALENAKERAAEVRHKEEEAHKILRQKVAGALGCGDKMPSMELAHQFEARFASMTEKLTNDHEIKRLTAIIDKVTGALEDAGHGPKSNSYWRPKA